MAVFVREEKVCRGEFGFGSEKLIVETGHLAKQASGSVTVRVGDTVVLVAVAVSADIKEGQDFFPLTVDYRERTYAAGKIPGGFFKRETRARENETLTSRLIDRAIRPLFPENFRNPVQVSAVVISADRSNDTDVPAIIGTSVALMISTVPFAGPVAAVRIGMIDGQFVINPKIEQQEKSQMDLVVAGNKKGFQMVECGSNEIPEDKMLEALDLAQKEIARLCQDQEGFTAQCSKPKMKFEPPVYAPELVKDVESSAREKIREFVRVPEKSQREDAISQIKKEVSALFAEKYPDEKASINAIIENILYEEVRAIVLKDKVRADGRTFTEIRQINCETGVLPRTHGSAVFTRGQTQGLVTVTLGTPDDKQVMDVLNGEYKERFMLHYNFPGFATGEPKPERSPGRREIGHGALARRALLPLVPTEEEFPYALRVVSEILESNGSSSMASVCGGSLALFDAGVPMKAACSGIAMGLVTEQDENGNTKNFAILSDIIGLEDFMGDMDFKVAGTRKGITALQMDLKIAGISIDIMRQALAQANDGRMHIMGLMDKAMGSPRAELSAFAPRMITVKIPVDKIGALIGPGGKNIRRIIEESGAEINVEDDGSVFISGLDAEKIERARAQVEGCTAEVEVGRVYKGKVTRLMNFGAFVEVLPGKEGLVHVSELDVQRVERVEDFCKEGDSMEVKCIEIDSQGRVNLSRRAAVDPNYVPRPSRDGDGPSRGPRRPRY